jgi:hypothetical protein
MNQASNAVFLTRSAAQTTATGTVLIFR